MNRLFILLVLSLTAFSARADSAAILVFGDSISAGFGLTDVETGWVSLLRTKLKDEGYGYQVVNASVSGETTAGGLARLPRALAVHHPQLVILELGGNDGLRALPVTAMHTNLARMIALSRSAGASVVLLGMRIPPNYGPEYTEAFFSSYVKLGQELGVPVLPFLLNDIALNPALMQADNIHPNAQGQPRLLANVWPVLRPLLRK